MIIDIGNGVDESVVMWKYNDKDKWRDADIDELINLYESVVRCKDCKHFSHYEKCGVDGRKMCGDYCGRLTSMWVFVDDDDFCSRGERREP